MTNQTPQPAELKPCAHCGHPAEMEGSDTMYSAVCIFAECGARGPYAETAEFATTQWNRRALPAQPSAPVVTAAMIRAALECRPRDDEGEMSPVCDIIDYQPNKQQTIVRQMLAAALASQAGAGDGWKVVTSGYCAVIGGWIYEDKLPKGFPYADCYPYSRIIGGVRMFPYYENGVYLGSPDDVQKARELPEGPK